MPVAPVLPLYLQQHTTVSSEQVSALFPWPVPSLPETQSREDFKYQRSDNKIKARVDMQMFY